MGRSMRTLGPTVTIAGALAWWGLAVMAAQAPVAGGPPQARAVGSAQAGGYVGEDTCLTCHEQQSYKGTAHALKGDARTPAATHGCESCHGPGQAHVDAGGDKTKIKTFTALAPAEANAVCTTCHTRGAHLLWESSAHENRNVTCVTCHSVHRPKGEAALLKGKTEADTCGVCHRDKVQKLYRSAHMPVQAGAAREGKMTCSSCHNPHGSTNVKLLKAGQTVNDSCLTCHAEKRGPYLWEHAAVAESCTSCHDPHGSSNDRMLVAKQPFLCQRCHVTSRHPPTIYDNYVRFNTTGANRILARSCTVCHQNIHGSNAASGKFFLR
jgi:DmsE family decaheme c-type cytochrome